LEQFGVGKLTPSGVLATDHADEPEIGFDEALASLLSFVLEDLQFLLGRIGKTGAGDPCVPRQQASLDGALQLNNLCACQWGFDRYIVKGLRHVGHCAASTARRNT
jgi:hypothetical protein